MNDANLNFMLMLSQSYSNARRLTTYSNFSMIPSACARLFRRVVVPRGARAMASETNSFDLNSFANLDLNRHKRTGFPEAVFSEGKTPDQIAMILDDMARHFNEKASGGIDSIENIERAILATRVTPEMFQEIKSIPLSHGHLVYHSTANIVSMIPTHLKDSDLKTNKSSSKKVVVATAGTTDIPVAEEAAVVLEAAQCEVDRIYDVGVAGLHRVLKALPKIQSRDVKCIIVCAGMDGALPSVIGGLVSCPVIAVPTSIGYGVSLGGISAMLTMLNSCAPGVGVVNIDNGFGAAALAHKCVYNHERAE